MENREFISAANLPMAEGDEVSVLCVENGEMKQKPAKGLGGGNVITIRTTVKEFSDAETEITIEPVPAGTFECIKNGLLNAEPVIVAQYSCGQYIVDGKVEEYYHRYSYCYVYRPEGENIPDIVYVEGEGEFVILPDDRIMTQQQFEEEMGGN